MNIQEEIDKDAAIISRSRWLIYAAYKWGQRDTRTRENEVRSALRDLLTKTLGRKPTKEELESAMNCCF